jgi:predicted transposase YbfD/YdcC
VELRALRVHEVEPDAVGFAGARSLVVVRSTVDIKKSGKSTTDTRYYLTSIEARERGAEAWQALIRGHWAGVEIRNHWRRDALMGEDRSRTRKPRALGNLAILRSTLLAVLCEPCQSASLPEIMERLHSNPAACLDLLRRY